MKNYINTLWKYLTNTVSNGKLVKDQPRLTPFPIRNEARKLTLLDAQEGTEYIVQDIITDDDELNAFLFSLGCYSGEPITVIAHRKSSCTVSIKDARYNIDNQLAAAIAI